MQKLTCPCCKGAGSTESEERDEDGVPFLVLCRVCKGKGTIPKGIRREEYGR